ncbi:hypothetical protein A4R26_02095 [Niastella populi]|uniref:Uncharacterized protein n=1 Tax=Niastella populi TaxID=550983 RepID=A0A1V9GD57_9BACT|nr:hypothetical protein A4R26_02095 [Niastella populi]
MRFVISLYKQNNHIVANTLTPGWEFFFALTMNGGRGHFYRHPVNCNDVQVNSRSKGGPALMGSNIIKLLSECYQFNGPLLLRPVNNLFIKN